MYIYIHIPFCSKICNYCDFPKMLYNKDYIKKYLDRLRCEIISRYKDEEVLSIYIGGGTPTCLEIDELTSLLEITNIFKKSKKIEFTVESNIESLDRDKIRLLKSYGVNRISLGVQSFNENTLRELGRCHSKEMVKEVISDIKSIGINNISIDYIYGVNNSISEVKEDISIFLKLNIPHISTYSLIIEDNTIFGINKRCYIDEDIDYEMYKYIEDTLTKAGYKHYEISNYSRDNYISIHNLNYWNNGSYYGFGLGAVSYLDNYRIKNTLNLNKYLKGNYIEESIYEDIDVRISNEFILGLRKVQGISISHFKLKYNKNILDIPKVRELLKEEKLVIDNDNIYISPKYFYLSNEILINFI